MRGVIKFKFWNPHNKTMLNDHTGWAEDMGINETLACSAEYGFIPFQFTGLLDSKGVEIYEGDVMKLLNRRRLPLTHLWEVIWSAPSFIISSIVPEGVENGEMPLDDSGPFYISVEIVGNIYENPELLTQTNQPS